MHDFKFDSYPDGRLRHELLGCYIAFKSIRFLDHYHPAPSLSLVLLLMQRQCVNSTKIPTCSTPNLPLLLLEGPEVAHYLIADRQMLLQGQVQ